jgi:hypothetical protein
MCCASLPEAVMEKSATPVLLAPQRKNQEKNNEIHLFGGLAHLEFCWHHDN